VQLEQRQTLSQKLVLTQTMRQSLDCLQLSAPELAEYVQEVALSNPLLDVQSPTYYETELPSEAAPAEREPLEVREADSWRGVTSSGMEDVQDFTAFLTREKTFRDHLTEQIGQMKLVDDELLRLCRFLIDCLDERGYLDCPLEELSREFDIPLFSLEQALFAVQMLDPPGVGARNLSECLTLQLAQNRSLDPLALKIARNGLEMLGKRNFSGLAVLLGVSVNEAKAAASKVLALNPIPSRSFAGSEQIAYVAPDAEFSVQQGQLVIELNERILPRLSVNAEYAALMNTSDDPEVQRYVKEKLSEAQALIKGVHTRCDTLIQMLTLIGREQHGFFCGGEALLPVTMQQLSEKMGVSTSTVSRAAQNKYIQFQGRIIPVRSFFTTAIRPDAAVSSHAVKQRLQSLIRAEDPAAPSPSTARKWTFRPRPSAKSAERGARSNILSGGACSMASVYDRTDIYDLFDSPKKDAQTLSHWQTVFDGRPIRSALDVSIGTGSLTLPLGQLGVSLYGSDLSSSMLARCRKKADERGIAIDLRQSDFRDLTSHFDRSFDCVMSTGNSLAYVTNNEITGVLEQMDALVEPGGCLYFDLRNWDRIVGQKKRFYCYNPAFLPNGDRVNLMQVWDHLSDGSIVFNLVYTFERDNKIFQKERFEEHYHPVPQKLLLDKLTRLGYQDIQVKAFPVQFGVFDIENSEWYCVLAHKAK